MSSSPRHGDPGCRCEACLAVRITLTTERAADGRDVAGLRTILDGFTGRSGASTEVLPLRSAS